MKSHYGSEQFSTKNTNNNPQVSFLTKNKQTNITVNKSPIIKRKPKDALEESICFISPRKIGYFQSIDESCLNESQRTIFKRQSEKTEGRLPNGSTKERASEIDYRSIKKCLSPRPSIAQCQPDRSLMNQNSRRQQSLSKTTLSEDMKFEQRLIADLKMQILEMGQLLQEKQKIIEDKNAKIADLERELGREQANQTTFLSAKSISTYMEDRTSSIIEPFPHFNFYQNGERLFEVQSKLQSYESQMKKLQIQIDILKKYRFDKQKMEVQMAVSMKKNESLRRKNNRLTDKNNRLVQELNRYKHEYKVKDDKSIILQYSPEKNSIQ